MRRHHSPNVDGAELRELAPALYWEKLLRDLIELWARRGYNSHEMARVSTRTRFALVSKAFGGGNSPLLDSLAQLSVLYEDLRIEMRGLDPKERGLKLLDELGSDYRANYFFRRSLVTILEFRGALRKLSKTPEFKAARGNIDHDLVARVENALGFFDRHHTILKDLRNDIGGHFHDRAAAFATRHAGPESVAIIEITFHRLGTGGGAKLHYAGEIAATAFARSLPRQKPLAEEVKGVLQTIRDCYFHATNAMHALVVAFLWDRF